MDENNSDMRQLMAAYKFTIAFEDSACFDYTSNKLILPLLLGSVPIYFGDLTVEVSSQSYGKLPFNRQLSLRELISRVNVARFTTDQKCLRKYHALNYEMQAPIKRIHY